MIRLVLPWECLAQANHRLIPHAVYDRSRSKWVGRMVPNSDYTKPKDDFERRAIVQMRQRGFSKLSGPVAINMVFYEPDLRRRDPSNYQKMIEDALSEIAYLDDYQIHDCHWTRGGIDRVNPRVEITVRPMKGAF